MCQEFTNTFLFRLLFDISHRVKPCFTIITRVLAIPLLGGREMWLLEIIVKVTFWKFPHEDMAGTAWATEKRKCHLDIFIQFPLFVIYLPISSYIYLLIYLFIYLFPHACIHICIHLSVCFLLCGGKGMLTNAQAHTHPFLHTPL